jgi:hypothetical protein
MKVNCNEGIRQRWRAIVGLVEKQLGWLLVVTRYDGNVQGIRVGRRLKRVNGHARRAAGLRTGAGSSSVRVGTKLQDNGIL